MRDHNNNRNDPSDKSRGSNQFKPLCLSPEDPCPIHGGSHKWKECFDNKFGNNYRPPRGYIEEKRNNQNNVPTQRRTGYLGPTHQTHYNQDAPSFASSIPMELLPIL